MLILTSACSSITSTDASGILLQADKVINFSDDIAGGSESGWSPSPDSGGTWSASDQTFLKFRYEEKFENGLSLKITMSSFVNPKNPKVDLVLIANGEEIDNIVFNEKSPGGEYSVLIPEEILSKSPGEILLSFQITGAASPKDLGVSEDLRKLGIFLIKVVPTAS
jgi:hypothetical protein